MQPIIFTTALASLASLAFAAPITAPEPVPDPQFPWIDNTLFGGEGIGGLIGTLDLAGSSVSDIDEDKTCRAAYYIVVRGSMEPGTIGPTVAPPVCKGLRAKYGAKIGCQGMTSAEYSGSITDNLMPIGTSQASVDGVVAAFKRMSAKCPNAKFVTSGYSQGAAVLHNVVPLLPANIKNQIVGIVLFGDTKNKQLNGAIDGFPQDKIVTYCDKDDGVCWGGLTVTAGHVAYTKNGDEQKAIDFFTKKIGSL